MKPCLQLKRFPSQSSGGNRARDRLIIKPTVNHSAIGRREPETERQTDNQHARARETEREREREGEMNSVLLTLQQLHS